MKLLIRSAKIIDPSSKHNGTVADLFIEDGIIKHISKPGSIKEKADKIIEVATQLHTTSPRHDELQTISVQAHQK